MKTYRECLIDFLKTDLTVNNFIATHPEYAGAPLPVLTHEKLDEVMCHYMSSIFNSDDPLYYEEFCKAFPELVGGAQPEPEQPKLYTLDEIKNLPDTSESKQWTPQVGEEVEVTDDGDEWRERKFLGMFDGFFMVKGIGTGIPVPYKLCRQINKPVIITTSKAIEIIKSAKGIIGEVVIKEDEK